MKKLIGGFVLIFFLMQPAYGEDVVQEWLNLAIEELRVKLYSGDLSSAKRRLTAILEEDPTNLEARWQLVYTNHLARPKNWDLLDRSQHLTWSGPQIQKILKLAHEQNKPAFAHYVKAWEGLLYNAFPHALKEIDHTLSLEPQSVRALMLKGRILVAKGDWEDRDEDIRDGIHYIQQAWKLSKDRPSPYYKEENYHFRIAHSMWHLHQRPWNEVTAHYEQAIQHATPGTTIQAYAWTNLSKAYRLQGQCDKAKEAAENASSIMEMKSAQRQKEYAEFCLEMKKLGIALPVKQSATNPNLSE